MSVQCVLSLWFDWYVGITIVVCVYCCGAAWQGEARRDVDLDVEVDVDDDDDVDVVT